MFGLSMYVVYKAIIVLTWLTAGNLASQLKFHSKQHFCLILCALGKLTVEERNWGETVSD